MTAEQLPGKIGAVNSNNSPVASFSDLNLRCRAQIRSPRKATPEAVTRQSIAGQDGRS